MKNVMWFLHWLGHAFVLTTFMGLVLFVPSSAHAANSCVWTGASDTNWANASNWSSCGGLVPQTVDTVSISNSANQPTISSDVSIAALTLNTGSTLTMSSNTLIVNGSINISADGGASTTLNNSGTLTQSSGTMTLSRTAVSGTANINLAGTGTWNINNLTMSSTTTNYNLANGATYNVAGDITRNGGILVPGTSTVVMTGSGKLLKGNNSHTYYNLTIASGASISNPSGTVGNITISKDLTVIGTFTQDATRSITFNYAGTSNLAGGGSISLGNATVSGSTALNAGTQNFTVVGTSWSVSSGGTFNGGTATITFAPGSGNTTTISGAGTHNLNNVTISSGTLSHSAGTVRVSGNWINDAAFTAGSGTVTFNGTATQTIGGSNTTTFNNLTINSGAIVVLSTKPNVNGTVTNSGLLRETLSVTGSSDVDFACLGSTSSNCSAYKGVTLNASGGGDLGSTIVDVVGNSLCGGVTGTVKRCFDLRPTNASGRNATVTLDFLNSELNGETCATLNAWRYNGTTFVSAGTTGTRQCSSDPRSIQTTGVANFSVFTLKTNSPSVPTPITIASIEAESGGPDLTFAASGVGVLGVLLFGWIGWVIAKQRNMSRSFRDSR